MKRSSELAKVEGEFVIVVDQREKYPYENFPRFRMNGQPVIVVQDLLPAGDYSIRGFETRIAIERKRPCELFTCFTTHRDRFEREWQKLASYDVAVLVIEGDLQTVSTWYHEWKANGETHRSKVSPHVIVASLIDWMRRYRVCWIPAGNGQNAGWDRRMGESLTFRILENFFDHQLDFSSTKPTQEADRDQTTT